MSRYFTTPSAPARSDSEWYDRPLIPDLSVPDHAAADTGLLDAKGKRIWRAPNPMGFVW